MLITDLSYRQKYLTTCMEITNYLITFSGMGSHFKVVPRFDGWWWEDNWYFPETNIYLNDNRHCGLLFEFKHADNPRGLLAALMSPIRSLARQIRAYDENAPLPTSEELYDTFLAIYERIWESKK